MKLATIDDRAVLVVDDRVIDVAEASGGQFGPDPMAVFERWAEFRTWAAGSEATGTEAGGTEAGGTEAGGTEAGGTEAGGMPLEMAQLGCPVPRPRQVFAIGLNYRSHAEESGMAVPEFPATFTKFPASLSGPFADIELEGDTVDWEVELVVVIGERADRVAEGQAWNHIAGLTVGQDISDRTLQFAAGAQFSLGKSRRGFGPMGPWVVTADELADPNDLALRCSINGETVQDARTSDLIFDVPRLIADLSGVLPLLPGDVIFTGTPAGVGVTSNPARFLQPGDVVESWIEGIGTIRNACR